MNAHSKHFRLCRLHGLCYNHSVWYRVTAAAATSIQLCLTLCDPTDSNPPSSPIPGVLQARTLEWVAISFSNAWKWKVKVKSLSRVWPSVTPRTAAYQAPPSMGFSRQEYWSGCHCLLHRVTAATAKPMSLSVFSETLFIDTWVWIYIILCHNILFCFQFLFQPLKKM